MTEARKRQWLLAAALLIACVAAVPLFSEPGLLNTRGGGDSPFLLQRLHQLETALRDGHFPVRWMPDANYGYGYPFYNFYAPLSIYITAVFRIIGFSFVQSIKLSQLAGFLVAAWGAFALGRRWFESDWAGFLAAAVYTLAPFHLVNVYVRGDSLAEFWAMAFYPLVILAADALLDRSAQWWHAVALALAYAALILSHNISALIFSPFLLLFIGLRWLQHNYEFGRMKDENRSSATTRATENGKRNTGYGIRPLQLVPVVLALLLALALAAWFFVPALAEQDLVQLTAVTEGYFNYNTHFLGTADAPLVQRSLLFDYTVDGRSAFRMGLMQTVLAVVALIALWWPQQEREAVPPRLFITLAILVTTVMLTPLSRRLWQSLPLLPFTQFPWRFLSVQAFGIAMAAGALIHWRRWLDPLVWFPLVALLLAITGLGRLQTDHIIVTDADVTAERLAQYEWFTGNVGTTVSAEYLPQTVQPRPFTSPWLERGERHWVQGLRSDVTHTEPVAMATARQVWQVETAAANTLLFSTLHWPGWTATIDGAAAAVAPAPGSGLIMLDVPPGNHTVTLQLTRTPVQRVAEWVSLTAVVITVTLLLIAWMRARRRPALLQPFIVVAGVVALLVLVAAVMPRPTVERDTLTWDFAQLGYLHHAPDGILFAGEARLLNYEISRDDVQAGDEVTIWLHWDGLPPGATVALTTPAAVWPQADSAPPPLTARTGQKSFFTLPIPEDAPSGLVIPRVTTSAGGALTASGRTRGALFLRPIRIVNRAPATTEADLAVRAVAVGQRPGTQILDVQLAWHTGQPLSRNYNVALRLTDANGNFLRLADRQPGYGFQPSSLWPPGEWVYDWQSMALPPPEEGHQRPFLLVVQLYDAANSDDVVLTQRLGTLDMVAGALTFRTVEPSFSVPAGIAEETAVFGDCITLHGYTLAQNDDALQLGLVWGALQDGDVDLTRFVHLLPAADVNMAPVAQHDAAPQNNSYPTSQWQAGEVVSDGVTLSLADVPPGTYRLAVGFYQMEGEQLVRETAVGANGQPLPDNRLLLTETITVP